MRKGTHSCKFKLAPDWGLPCLKPLGFSGGLLPRRCTITAHIPNRLSNQRFVRSLRFRSVHNGDCLRTHFFYSKSKKVSHSILLFCGTVLTLTRTWISQAICLFGCPDFPHEKINLFARLSACFP